MPRLMPALLAALAAIVAFPTAAAAVENLANEPPFGGDAIPQLTRPPSDAHPPSGFRLSARQAIAIASRAGAVEAERAADGPLDAKGYERGDDEWEVDFFDPSGARVAQATVVDADSTVLGAWHDQQLETPLARGYDGAVAQKVNAPYVWLVLSLAFIAPFFDRRRPFRLVHLDLLVLLGLGISLFFFNRGEITTSVPLTYPVLGYFLVRMLIAGLWPRERQGPVVPSIPIRWLAWGAVALAVARVVLNVVDSHVIDIGVAGVIGADHVVHGHELYAGSFSPGVHLRGDVYGPFNYLAYVPFELIWPWHGAWVGSVSAAHAASISFDLLTALGLLALGRRLRAGSEGRALGVALAFAWLACPWTLYVMNANANDGLVALLSVGALLTLSSPAGRGAMVALATAAKMGPAALAPLFATGRERRVRDWVIFGVAFGVVMVVTFAPFIPSGGVSEVYDRTFGYQAARSSPFSIWGLAPSLDPLQTAVRAGAVALAVAVALWPRSRTTMQVAALAAAVTIATQLGATHWFYFYVVWFLPFVLVAAFGAQRTITPASSATRPAAAS